MTTLITDVPLRISARGPAHRVERLELFGWRGDAPWVKYVMVCGKLSASPASGIGYPACSECWPYPEKDAPDAA